MSSIIRPSTADDQGAITELLGRIFGVGPDAPFLAPSLLHWKYWEQRDDFANPRSLVLQKDGRIVGHVGLWPITIETEGKTEVGVHMIDWASDPSAVGAGLSLFRHLTQTYDFIYSIGGSQITRSLLPKLGFRIVSEALTCVRPIRPWRQTLRESRDLRLPLRLVRNIWWSMLSATVIRSGWSNKERIEIRLCDQAFRVSERDSAFFRHLKRCPSARFLTFEIMSANRKLGSIALALVRHQARVAGVWLDDPCEKNWRIALQLAQQAIKQTDASECVVRCATETSKIAAGLTGMRVRSRAPVFLFRNDDTSMALPIQFQLCDNDALFA